MSEEIYSAAKAFFPKSGKTKEEVWEDLTAMFNPEGKYYTNYIDHRCPGLEPVKMRETNTISGYDVLKYTTGKHGVARYVHIVGVSLYESFSLDKKSSPDVTEHGHNSLSRTEFFLLEEKPNIWVEMRLRFKDVRQPFSLRNWLSRLLPNDLPDPADAAANELKALFSHDRDKVKIERDDSYRIIF